MDGLPRGYPDEQEGRWFPSDRGYGERYDDDRYRVPESRHAGSDPHPLDTRSPLDSRGPSDTRNPVGPRSGVEMPPYVSNPYEGDSYPADLVDPTGEHHTQPIDRVSLRRPPDPVPTPSPTVYKTRRVGVAGLIAVVAAVAELLLARVLLAGEFGPAVAPGAVLGGLFAMTGTPLAAIGLYALITGPAATAGAAVGRAWLRTPLAYLPVGLILLVAAGLAAS